MYGTPCTLTGAAPPMSLGSGISGGALGGIEALGLPADGVGFWPLIGMAAILGGTMRSPLTGVVFALELPAMFGGLADI